MNRRRPNTKWTEIVLHTGSFAAAGLLALGFVAGLVAPPAGRVASFAGVVVLLGTPPAALVTTFIELRRLQPRAAILALVVLGVIGFATVLAAFNS